MEELLKLKRILDTYREKNPRAKRYPKKFWEGTLPLARRIGVGKAAKELGISLEHLRAKLKNASPSDRDKSNFVQIPPTAVSVPQGLVTLEFPGGLVVRIER